MVSLYGLPVRWYGLLLMMFVNSSVSQGDGFSYNLDICDDVSTVQVDENKSIIYPLSVTNLTSQPLTTFNKQSQTHQSAAQIGFRYQNQDFIVSLQLNSKIRTSKYYNRGKSSRTRVYNELSENCYYQGIFIKPGKVDDFVAVSTCHGVRGVMLMNGTFYEIHPAASMKTTQVCWPHVLTRSKAVPLGTCRNTVDQWKRFNQLHSAEYYRLLSNPATSAVSTGAASWTARYLPPKHLELGLVVDREMSAGFSNNQTMIRSYLLDVTNLIDLFFRRLNIQVSLVYEEIWTSVDRTIITYNGKENLQAFLTYAQSSSSRKQYDIVHLLSGRQFEGGFTGLSIPDSICTDRSVAVISTATLNSNAGKLASVISHMIGHNIGLLHDSSDCDCREGKCIMGDISGDDSPYSFSACSYDKLRLLSQVSLGECLTNQTRSKHYSQICGNGITERGEQCDCGPSNSCEDTDPCCDASTCLLKTWATCRSGECCHRCRPKSATSVCRAAKDDCDAPELCDGVSGECPADVLIQDGQPCDGNESFCYQGGCPNKSKQCELLWGGNSISSPEACYNMYNPEGSALGHCGQSTNGNYKKCASKDTMCGLLQCTGGEFVPLAADVIYKKTSTNEGGGGEITCKTVNGKQLSESSDKGMVADGTRCGENHLCQGHVCIHISRLSALGCPVAPDTNITCSGHGRCTADRKCSCYSGYGGDICETPAPSTTFPPPVTERQATEGNQRPGRKISDGALSALILIVMLIAAAVMVTIFFYRKRTACFANRKYHVNVESMKLNGISNHVDKSTDREMCYTIPATYQHSGGRKRRRRHRRYNSSSSSEESSEGENEAILPCVIYDVPVTGQPAKGILKKTGPAEDNSSCSGSQCSCSQSCSCSNDEGEEMLPAESRLPRPQYSDCSIEIHQDISTNAYDEPNYIPDTNERHHSNPTLEPPNYDSYIISNQLGRGYHDSASDSAIDIQKGESSVSPHSETSAFMQLSPLSNGANASLASHYVTPLRSETSDVTLSGECCGFARNNYISPEKSSSTDSIQLDMRIPVPVFHESSHESLEDALMHSDNESIHSSMNVSDSPTPNSERDPLLLNGDESSIDYTTYSIRPINGPMRTFLPVERQPRDQTLYNSSDTKKPFISNNA